MSPREGDPATATIAAYAPASLSAEAAAFARSAAARAAPRRRERAKALLYAAGRLAAFGESVGMELSAEALLGEATIERFILTGCPTVSAATRRTLRTNLRALARALDRAPPPAPLARERAKRPYAEAEIAGYLRLARAQPTEARRAQATALVCLGAGAGLVGSELRHLSGPDVIRRSGGLVVAVGGRRARSVPVLERFCEPLAKAAAFASGSQKRSSTGTDRALRPPTATTSPPERRMTSGPLRWRSSEPTRPAPAPRHTSAVA